MRRALMGGITTVGLVLAGVVGATPSSATSIAWDSFASVPMGSSVGDVSALSATDAQSAEPTCELETLPARETNTSMSTLPALQTRR